jgi:hypothetical protein
MLFAFFGFWTTTLAAGAAAVSVPIIIHLLNRRRFKIVVWAAMRFLLAAQRQNTRRMRLEQLILLLVRCAVVALVVFAMASVMPWAENVWAHFWPEGGGPAAPRGSRIHHVFVLDASLSMNASDGGPSAFERARQLTADKIKQASAGDTFSILLMKDNPSWIIGQPSPDSRKVLRELEAIRSGHGNASAATTLNMVASKLGEAAAHYPNQMVYFLTDLQKATWTGVPPTEAAQDGGDKAKSIFADIKQRARTVFVDVGRDGLDNLAVTDLAIGIPFVTTGMEAPILTTVANFGKETKQNLRIELLVGKAREAANDAPLNPRVVGQELNNIRAGDRVSVAFKYKFPEPGTYAVQVKLSEDVLELDNVRTVIVTVKDTIPVMIVNGKAAALDRYDRASEYLRLALNPFPKGAEPKFAPLRPKVVNLPQLADVPDEEWLSYDLIVLCDVNQLGAGELRRLDAHVRRGGGLIVSLGDKAVENLDLYNRHLFKNEHGLLPAQLFKKVTAPAEHHFVLNAQEDQFFEPPLKDFADLDDRVSLKTGRFRSYVEAKPAGDAKVRTIMTFMPEQPPQPKVPYDKTLATTDPAILEWNPPLGKAADTRTKDGKALPPARYRGKVVLLTSTVNMDWTTWPGSPSFGALMQELARVALAGRLREQGGVVGTLLEEFLPDAVAEVEATVHYPPANPAIKPPKTRTQLVEEINVFRWTDTDISGLYRVVFGNSPQEVPFAVNVPASTPDQRGSESDLTRLDKAKLDELFPGWDFQMVRDARDAIFGGGPAISDLTPEREPIGPDIAAWALFLVLILLFAEVVLAWQFGHYTTVEGTTAPASTSLVLPIAVACLSALCFIVIGYVLFDASRTGDFLGFLPRTLRNFMERGIGAPPAPAGEESRWELGSRDVFFDGSQDAWFLGTLGVIALVMTFFIYRLDGPNVNPIYKGLLAGLRIFLIWLTLGVLMPQREWRIDRQGWPDIVVLLDTSRSMGEPDHYNSDKLRDRARQLGEVIQKLVKDQLPERIRALEAELAAKRAAAEQNEDLAPEVKDLEQRLKEYQQQVDQVNSPSWRPTRLQLVQAIMHQPELDWLKTLVTQRRMKVHVYQLDAQGRAIKLADKDGAAGEITEQDPRMIERASQAVARLEADGKDSRLGTALRQVIDQYRGASLSAVIMFTDGVTTRDETIAQVGEYAAQKAVPLYFVGMGDDHEVRDLKLHDLLVDDVVYVNDRVVFEARLTGKGYKKDFAVPVVLRVREKDGREKELARTMVKVNPQGKAERFKLVHQPKEVGRKMFVIEVEPPKADKGEKQPHPANLRLERAIEVVDAKQIRVLYAEGQPRYEFRFVKFLLERESPDGKKNKSIELKTFLQDADADFAATDKTALTAFPATPAELGQYDVVILGDIDPNKLGNNNLRNLADFVRGEDSKGQKVGKGGGLLLIAGGLYNPHAFQKTPLADVIPIEPGVKPAEPVLREDKLRLELTPIGRMHPIFRFSSDDAQNMIVLQRLAPMYWWSGGYRLKPLAEVLAVHPALKGDPRDPASHDGRLPLVVQQFVGSGRSMFFGFEESWRWRFREDEVHFNNFWIQTMRYLSRTRPTRTDLRLDRQTPYRVGEPIKITVRFPDSQPLPGITDNKGPKADVTVVVEYRPPSKQDAAPEPEVTTVQLAKLEGSWGTFEHTLSRTREGKYRFRLISPDVSRMQPDGEKPSAEGIVELPPGELDRLRMNEAEMSAAAEATQGKFYTILTADDLLEDLPSGYRVSMAAPMPPIKLWNHWLAFVLVMFLLTSEWVLRKRKHLL